MRKLTRVVDSCSVAGIELYINHLIIDASQNDKVCVPLDCDCQ